MEWTRVVNEDVLAPIPGPNPAGEDLRGAKLWVDLRAARPRPALEADNHEWTPANPVKPEWPTYKELVEQALCTRSKDLELGLFLTEACARVHGFAGVRDGLWTLGGLIKGFLERGLFPEPEEGDAETQYGTLNWLNDKLPDVIREIPLTKRAAPGVNYSLNYRTEAQRQNGIITAAEFEAAAAAGKTEEYESLEASIAEARAALNDLEQDTERAYGQAALSFVECKQTLEECSAAVQAILRRRKPEIRGGATTDAVAESVPLHLSIEASAAVNTMDQWGESERLARAGETDRALSAMVGLASAEANGRIRFQRKLLLADLCLQTERKKLARSILEELNEIVDQHKLVSWETSELVGAVWTRLVRCYRDTAAGIADADKEAEFFLKLSRLDPWQALACGETTVGKE